MKGPRRRSREIALQALYAWQLAGGNPLDEVRLLDEERRADRELAEALVRGVLEHAGELESLIAPCLDRDFARLSPVERAVFLLEKVGITAAASRLAQYPHQLSGGLRQRVMIAMALMCGPDLMIADEPTTALDVTVQAQILLLLAQLRREFGMGLILITHDLGIVARVADRVAVMYAGQIVEQGTAAQVFREPRHPYTRGLMACIPVPGKVARGSPLGSIPGMVPSLLGSMSGCSFRSRCGLRRDACEADVALVEATPGHDVRCIASPEELASMS